MAQERIYIARPTQDGPARLVKAGTQAQAYRHLARASWALEAASALQVADLMGGGTKLETAADNDEQDQPALPLEG